MSAEKAATFCPSCGAPSAANHRGDCPFRLPASMLRRVEFDTEPDPEPLESVSWHPLAEDPPHRRHRWDDAHERCAECGELWPCDVAKAWRDGYGFGRLAERYGKEGLRNVR